MYKRQLHLLERGLLLAAQKQQRIAVAGDGIGVVLVDGLELALGLQNDTGGDVYKRQGVDRIKLAVCCRDGCHLVAGFVAGDSPVWIRKKSVNKVFSNIYLYLRQRKQRDFSRKLIK